LNSQFWNYEIPKCGNCTTCHGSTLTFLCFNVRHAEYYCDIKFYAVLCM
jgi:hypothetical protein